MSFIAQRASSLRPSPTIALTTKAKELKESGKNVIVLTAGEPDFDTPDNIKDYAIKAIKAGKTKYTPVGGTKQLKEAIVAKFKRENNISYSLKEVIAGTGAKQVLFNAFMATVEDGDEIIIPSPYWVSYPDIISMFGGKSVFVETKPENNLKMTSKELENAITNKTKWIVLNSPSNPSGEVYTKAELESIGEVVSKHPNVYVMSDDIYEHLVYNCKFYTLAEVCPNLQDRVFTLNGVSKSYSMTGWRMGYGAIKNQKLIDAMDNIQSQSTSNPSSISQEAAVEALNGDQSFIKSNQEVFQQRRDILVSGLNKIKGIKCPNPKGAFYVFFSMEGLIGKKTPSGNKISNSMDFTTHLLNDSLVATVPGSAFGFENYVRASYSASKKDLEDSVERIKLFVESLA